MIRHDQRLAEDRKRLRSLVELRDRVVAEIDVLRSTLEPGELETEIRAARARLSLLVSLRPPKRAPKMTAKCGTETGYQRHRYFMQRYGEGVWPLPADDPCGCRAAHTKHEADRKKRRQLLAEMGLAA